MTAKKQETFSSLMKEFLYHYDQSTVFDDFLTMTLCAFSRNPKTRLSNDEDLYLERIAKYKESDLRFHFRKMLDCLTFEMEERISVNEVSDILGEYYQENLYKKGSSQYFTPWPICTYMAGATLEAEDNEQKGKWPKRILDPACGSGRMLIAAANAHGRNHHYFGIDIDPVCVKMTTLNLFLNGIFHCEVMQANALLADDYHGSYRTSIVPFGIFKIENKEKSFLWNFMRESLKPKFATSDDMKLASEENKKQGDIKPSQLQMF